MILPTHATQALFLLNEYFWKRGVMITTFMAIKSLRKNTIQAI